MIAGRGIVARILLLNANRVGIGTYHRALNFGRAISCGGHEAVMVTVSAGRTFTDRAWRDASGLLVVEGASWLDGLLPWRASGPLDIFSRFRRLIGEKWDLVYAFEYQPNISLPVYAGRPFRRFRLVSDWCDWHSGGSYHFGGKAWAHRIDQVFEEAIRKIAHHLTVINQVLLDRALKIGIPNHRISLIREGVDTEYMRPFNREESRQRVGLPPGVPLVGAIKDASRGNELLVSAFQVVRRRIPSARLLMVGKLPESVPRLAGQLGVLDACHFPGRVSDADMPRYLTSCDVMALPLEDTIVNRGRWPHKLGDMISCERPVVTSAGGEFPQLLGDRGCASLEAFNSEAFADAICRILESPGEAQLMAKKARDFARAELEWRIIGKQVLDVIERVA